MPSRSRATGQLPASRCCATAGCPRPARPRRRYCSGCYSARWRERHPEEAQGRNRTFTERQTALRRARAYVATMVRRGTLHEGRCGRCGAWETRPHWPEPSQPRRVEWYCAYCLGVVRDEDSRAADAAALREALDAIRRDVEALDDAARDALVKHLDAALPRWRNDFSNRYAFGMLCAYAVVRNWPGRTLPYSCQSPAP